MTVQNLGITKKIYDIYTSLVLVIPKRIRYSILVTILLDIY